MTNLLRWTFLACGVIALAACNQNPATSGDVARASGTPEGGAAPNPGANARLPDGNRLTGLSKKGSGSPRMRQAWNLLNQWDAAQASGNLQMADKLAGDIRQVVDSGFGEFQAAAGGSQGVELQYLSTSLLGFSSNAVSTPVLVKLLDSNDASLVANALVALNLRKDPATDLVPVLRWVDPRAPQLPRRYAPLVVATVIDAQTRSGRARDARLEGEAYRKATQLVANPDAYTRLHVTRLLGVLQNPGKTEYLLGLVRDREMRVRWSAAAALERSADPRGFIEVIRLLHETKDGSKHIIQDILVSYRNRMTRTQMTSAQIAALGTNAAQWSRWFSEYQRANGIRVAPSRS